MTRNQTIVWAAFAVVLLATVVVYTPGLGGPFLFDDSVHITQNRWVKIDSLSWDSLVRAWNSSFNAFPSDRPLAQLSFGINHAISGLDPWAFKAVNLALHLLTGIAVFLFARLSLRALSHGQEESHDTIAFAAMVAAFWMLNPLQVSTVLYTVQRMAQLSTLFLVLAMTSYLSGRLRLAEGKPGLMRMLAAIPLAAIGFFGKENAVLLPLLLLVCELTLLQRVPTSHNRSASRAVWVVLIVLPLVAGLVYLISHPELLNHGSRPFTFEERTLTQPRILWLYLKWLFVPDITELGLFHDDIPVSTGLFSPPITSAAIVGLLILLIAALVLRRKLPVFSFSVLFFLAAHALESSLFPLELVFEHRNYLASIGPLFLLGYLIAVTSQQTRFPSATRSLGVALLIAYAIASFARVQHWTSHDAFILASAENHPNSVRAQFVAGQMAISLLERVDGDTSNIATAAEQFLENGLIANERCINCLFGLIVLDLHLQRAPRQENLARLTDALRDGPLDTNLVSISQFRYLVDWLRAGESTLSGEDLKSIFEAARANPNWNRTGRAGIEAAYRKYFEFVAEDLESALIHAEAAIEAWPQQWGYRMQLAKLLRKMGRFEEARSALQQASRFAKNTEQYAEIDRLMRLLNQAAVN